MDIICQIAVRTISRFRFKVILFLLISYLFLFITCNTFFKLTLYNHNSFIIKTTLSRNDLVNTTLTSIDEISKISPLLSLNSTIKYNGYQLDCTINAIHNTFFDFEILEGSLFPNNSNMPFLLLNSHAASSLIQKEGITTTIKPNTIVSINANGTQSNAVICGIFNDNKNTPIIYMSYETAKNIFPRSEEIDFILMLSKKAKILNTINTLKDIGLDITYDPSTVLNYQILDNNKNSFLLISLILFICSNTLINNSVLDIYYSSSECCILYCIGLTENECMTIYYLRPTILNFLCLFCSAFISMLLNLCSLLSFFICFTVCIINATLNIWRIAKKLT